MLNLRRNTVLIFMLLVVCLLTIFPPKENLRLGRDLAGGVSLTYNIDLKPGDGDEVVDRMIQVLKERVDPTGLLEISFVRQGRDRVVVTMPLPTDEVKALKAEYDAAVEQFAAYEVNAAALERALRLSGTERIDAITALETSDAMSMLLAPVKEAAQLVDESDSALEALRAQESPDPDALDQAIDAVAMATIAMQDARSVALSRTTTPTEVSQAFRLSDNPIRISQGAGKEPLELPSARENAFKAIEDKLKIDGTPLPGVKDDLNAVNEAHAAYTARRKGLDDPADLERLLRGSGVLEFRIAPRVGDLPDEQELRNRLRERGPSGARPDGLVWRPIDKPESWYDTKADYDRMVADPASYFATRQGLVAEPYLGTIHMLLYDRDGLRLTKADGNWSVASASQSTDQNGRPAIGFRMDPRGAERLGNLTGNNLQSPMAIVLDDRVMTAPNINGRISSSGIIEGQFSPSELNYIIKTLGSGALSAKLGESPISVNNIAPELGADNLKQGLKAGYIALAAVGVFMVVYYLLNGVVSLVALMCNAIIILGIMSLSSAAFSLPGIAGIVLTFGMAVDANVLIYERIREELIEGNDLRTSVRLAFDKVFSTIVDANVTNLIVCFVLAYTATEDVKGFAITLGIGVVATMFSALVITRIIYTWLIEVFGVRSLKQLPMMVPFIQRALEPKIDFIKLRPLFIVISLAFMGLGVAMIAIQGKEMLDTEFRGGTAVTLQFKNDRAGQPVTLTRAEVENRIKSETDPNSIYNKAITEDPSGPLSVIKGADIIAVNPENDGVTSSRFQIKTTIGGSAGERAAEEAEALRDALANAFQDVLDIQPVLNFRAADNPDASTSGVVFPILQPRLGSNLGEPQIQNDVSAYINGVAIVLDSLEPRPSLDDLNSRLAFMRNQPEFASDSVNREYTVIVIEGTDQEVETAVVIAVDPGISAFDEVRWQSALAGEEWTIVRAALTETTTLAQVQQFSAEVAKNFQAQAIVAVGLAFLLIMIYIWVRFGSVRYSMAAIAALIHDVLIAIGLIAFAEIIYNNFGSLGVGLQPYKIDLALVAAILTIVGYSLNDTIIILDRVRENRGKLAYASREVVNKSISQTVSRTIITSGTTVVALAILFIFGGDALSSFSYALLCGVIVGTYSSIAVAAPLVYTAKIPAAAQKYARGEQS